MSPPGCSQTVPTALCPCCFQLSRATDLLSPPPSPSFLCPFSLCRDTEWAGPESLSQGKVLQAQKRHREGSECSQALQEALLAGRHTGTQHRAAPAGQREAALCSWTVGQEEERTKRPLTIPLFISTLVGWRLRLIHSG